MDTISSKVEYINGKGFNSFKIVTIFAFLLALSTASAMNQIDPINATKTVRKSTAKLMYGADLKTSCSATFLTKKILVTAAHCLRGQSPENIHIGIDGSGSFVVAKTLLPHHLFNAGTIKQDVHENKPDLHDIGLILLANELRAEIEPVPLSSIQNPKELKFIILSGFGPQSLFTKNSATADLHAEGYFFPRAVFVGETEVFLFPPSTACPGDSGGGVFESDDGELKLVGVINSGPGFCGPPTTTWIATPEINNWINESIKELAD